jgi:hypothetical protein
MKMMEMCSGMSMEECQSMMMNMMSNRPDFTNLQMQNTQKIDGTPELQALFFEWCHQIQDEMKVFAANNTSDINEIAQHFKLSVQSCEYILNRLFK